MHVLYYYYLVNVAAAFASSLFHQPPAITPSLLPPPPPPYPGRYAPPKLTLPQTNRLLKTTGHSIIWLETKQLPHQTDRACHSRTLRRQHGKPSACSPSIPIGSPPLVPAMTTRRMRCVQAETGAVEACLNADALGKARVSTAVTAKPL